LFIEYFSSVDENTLDFANSQNLNQFGKKIGINGRDNLESYSDLDIVFFSISEYRLDNSFKKSFNADKDFRKKLYSLHYGNWKTKIYDLGSLVNGSEVSDTIFAIENIIEFYIKNQIFVITIGGSQDLTLNFYNSIKKCSNSINLATIDNQLDFLKNGNIEESYLSSIIMGEDNKLNQFSNIGFQKHLTSIAEIDLIDKMKFEALNLGKVKSNTIEAEPILRDSNFISFDIKSIKSGDINNAHQHPNGLTSHEFCTLSRFSGLSSKSKVISFFENWDLSTLNSLLAESVWYVIDGFNSRYNENPLEINDDFITYHIEVDNYKFKFYKSMVTDRWWVEFINDELISISKNIISCSVNDYYNCKNSIISERILTRLKNKIT
tara:strand:- start:871 stop:2007 length:1137 start_codon:yes stop_codon:yes gene_type:complete